MSDLKQFTPVELTELEQLVNRLPLLNELDKYGGSQAVFLSLIAVAQRHALSDRHEAHVRELISTQDNACTADPIFTVEKLVRDWGIDTEYADHVGWYHCYMECEVLSGRESDRRKFEALEKGFEAGTVGDAWTRTGYRERWEFVQPFLTLEAAEKFREYMAHRLGETRIYVESGYRNYEWQWLRALFARV